MKTQLPIEVDGDGNLFRLVVATQELEAAFYGLAGTQGVVFHEGNKTPSAALDDHDYHELLERLEGVFHGLLDKFPHSRNQTISERHSG